MEVDNNRTKIYLTVNHHSIMMHHITQITFIGYRGLWNAFNMAVSFWRSPDNIMLVGKYHILPRNKANEQYF